MIEGYFEVLGNMTGQNNYASQNTVIIFDIIYFEGVFKY